MKTAEKILEETAEKNGYPSFPTLIEHTLSVELFDIVINAIIEAQKEAIEECAITFYPKCEPRYECGKKKSCLIDKQSILSVKNKLK